MSYLGLSSKEKQMLEFEVVPYKARLQLTKMIRLTSNADDQDINVIKQNRFINIAKTIMQKPIYILESDDMGNYQPVEYAWHNAQIELIMRYPNTIELIETLNDFLENDLLYDFEVNEVLAINNCSFSFKKAHNGEVSIDIIPVADISDELEQDEQPNIRQLVDRIDTLLPENDYSGVLHACATIFETLAKDISSNTSIEDKSLGSFFDLYRNDSKLPEPILDYILEIFNKRNEEPLAGHGRTAPPDITREDATIIAEMTKAFVRIERQLIKNEMDSLE